MESNNFDREKLDLEKQKSNKDVQLKEAELKLKEEEFDLKKKEIHKSRYKLTPVHATIIAAILGIIAQFAAVYAKNIFSPPKGGQEQRPISQIDSTTPKPADTPATEINLQGIQPIYEAPTSSESASTQVYICDSKTSERYHRSKKCGSLSNCKSEIRKISLEDAREMSRTPCGHEY